MYDGLRLAEEGELEIEYPRIESWRTIPNTAAWRAKQGMFTVKPAGKWAAMVRIKSHLVATTGDIPLEPDWAHVYDMLASDGAKLYCRFEGEFTVAVAVQSPDGWFTPLAPDYTQVVANVEDMTVADVADINKGNWPNDLAKPWVLHVGPLYALLVPQQRQELVEKSEGYGLWVLQPGQGDLTIYEVLS